MRKKGVSVLLVVIIIILVAGVGIGGAIWFTRPRGNTEYLALKKTIDDMLNTVKANEKSIKAAEQLVVELKNEQFGLIEKLANARIKEREVKEDFEKSLEEFNHAVRVANRLNDEIRTYEGETDLSKVVEIGGVRATLREHQMNLANINTETGLKQQTAELKRQFYESTKDAVEQSRNAIDSLRFSIMEWENKVTQFRIILQNNELQSAFLQDQADLYKGNQSRLETLMATAKSIETAFLKQQEVDNVIKELNTAKNTYEWVDLPKPSDIKITVPEGGWKEMDYAF